MIEKNQLSHLRKSLQAELLALLFEDRLFAEIDQIPIRRFPKSNASVRCCIYKDRAMTRYHLMSAMGFDIETQDDEFRSLASYAKEALDRESPDSKVLTIIDIACASCQQNAYMVTDLCKGCVARPCEPNCPKDAIQIINGKSLIDQEKCVSCGICKKVCPYNAIVYSPVPCEDKCPVDAISRNIETGKEEIDYGKCIFCGRCTRACPFGTIMERSEIIGVAKHLKREKSKLVALVAPSIVGQFPGTSGQVVVALKRLGFDSVYEVAYGADITAKKEAEELIEKTAEGQAMLGTSCCPAYVESVKKHVPDFLPFVSHTRTPMAYTAELAKTDHPDAVVVFIGPCIAKKFEGSKNPDIDYTLTYEELGAFFLARHIDVLDLPEEKYATEKSTLEAQRFCVDGGVAETVKMYAKEMAPDLEVKPLFINGLSRKGLKQLEMAAKGKFPNSNLLECMSCEGGCMAGPGVLVAPSISTRKLPKD